MIGMVKLLITIVWIIDILNIGNLGAIILDKTYPLNTGFWFLYSIFVGLDIAITANNNKNNDK